MKYGKVVIRLDKQIEKSKLSKTKIAQRAEMQRTQLNRYIKDEVSLIDKAVLGRLCTVLNCKISDILFLEEDTED